MKNSQYASFRKIILLLTIGMLLNGYAVGQDLMALLDSTSEPSTVMVERTFKTARLINGYNTEVTGKNDLVFAISHRFDPVSEGAYDFFGLDHSQIRIGFHYGITDRIEVGIGRSSYEKLFDGFVKAKLLRQKEGANAFPVSVTLLEGAVVKSLKWANQDLEYPFTARLYYVHELFISRKFNRYFSAQIVPVLVHRNMVETSNKQNTVPAVGIGGSFNINQWIGIVGEYYYLLPGNTADNYTNSFALGCEIETGGGHIFQVHVSNSRGMTEKNFIPETTGKWIDGDIALGFNIIRVFNLKKSK